MCKHDLDPSRREHIRIFMIDLKCAPSLVIADLIKNASLLPTAAKNTAYKFWVSFRFLNELKFEIAERKEELESREFNVINYLGDSVFGMGMIARARECLNSMEDCINGLELLQSRIRPNDRIQLSLKTMISLKKKMQDTYSFLK